MQKQNTVPLTKKQFKVKKITIKNLQKLGVIKSKRLDISTAAPDSHPTIFPQHKLNSPLDIAANRSRFYE